MKVFLNAQLLEDSRLLKPVPHHLRHLIVKWATTVRYYEHTWGYALFQEYISDSIKLYYFRTDLRQRVTFYVYCQKACVSLQFLLTGSVCARINGFPEIMLPPREFSFLYFPAASAAVTANPGITESVHYEIPDNLVSDFAKDNVDIKGMYERLIANSSDGLPDKRLNMDPTVLWWINRVLMFDGGSFQVKSELLICLMKLMRLYDTISADERMLEKTKISPSHLFLKKVWRNVRDNPDKQLYSLQALANEYHYSAQVIRVQFRNAFGETISEYLHRHCMLRGRYWLQTTDWPLRKIAEELGYENKKSLYRAISQWFKKTPEEIRREAGRGLN